jgi:mono/diheme cytochrome c family protein
MRVLWRALGVLLGVVLLAAAAGIAYLFVAFPKAGPPPELRVEATPARLERGRYLVESVTACLDCHSPRDFSRFAGPGVPGTEGSGGDVFGEEWGFPGRFVPANLTPHGIGKWTDGELLRAFTAGVSRDGRPLFPVMPYLSYANLSQEDAYSIIAYLRTLRPIPRDTAPSRANFPVNLVMRTIPKRPELRTSQPAPGTPAHGEYLVQISGCVDCHTIKDRGQNRMDLYFAGGMEFALPGGGKVRSANITPDPETGIGGWTREAFIARFKAYGPEGGKLAPVKPGEMNTVMPWGTYSGMTEQDLGAMYDQLRTLKPIRHAVERFTPPAGGSG